ncbi:response regulator [Legionella pneumophila serogroup 6]
MMNNSVPNEHDSAHSLRFLVVESSLGARILIRLHLLEIKHSVDMVWDDESAIELAFMSAYDFILVDKNLNCHELIVNIQNNSVVNDHATMIILTSTYTEENKSQGSAIYFKKPISKRCIDALQQLDFLKNLKK